MNFVMSALRLAFVDQMPGGEADDMCPQQFDPEALCRGLMVELEHTDSPLKALEIAMDHLKESECYYEALEEMEEELAGDEGGD